MLGAQRSKVRWKLDAWARVFVGATAACLTIYFINAAFFEVAPGTWWGLSYGWAAALLMYSAAAYAWRRRAVRFATRRGLGHVRSWLRFHVYGGLLSLLLVFMHIGFRLPTGGLVWMLLLLSLWTVLSGLAGTAVQKWYPRVLASGLSMEVLYERAPELVAELRERARKTVADSSQEVKDFYLDRLAPLLESPRVRWFYLIDIRGGIDSRVREFEYLTTSIGPEESRRIEALREIYRAKMEIDAQITVQRLLRLWPVIHVPLSLALLALLAVHIFLVLYY